MEIGRILIYICYLGSVVVNDDKVVCLKIRYLLGFKLVKLVRLKVVCTVSL